MKIAVLGVGNMGSWFARMLKKNHRVAVFDLDKPRARAAAEAAGAEVLEEMEGLGSFDPDILLNAVSLQNTVKAFQDGEKFLQSRCILADIASIKGEIPLYYKGCRFPFVSMHPMFGPTFADMGSLCRENAVIIKESDPEGSRFFGEFFRGLGLPVFEYTAEEHDEMMAYSLSLPFVSSMVFGACMKEKTVPGSTFARHREIARGLLSEDDRLLSEILFNKYSLHQLEKVTSRLEFLKHIIRGKDYEEARRFFDGLRENIG
jgi:prephenate dehydrogenase